MLTNLELMSGSRITTGQWVKWSTAVSRYVAPWEGFMGPTMSMWTCVSTNFVGEQTCQMIFPCLQALSLDGQGPAGVGKRLSEGTQGPEGMGQVLTFHTRLFAGDQGGGSVGVKACVWWTRETSGV